MRDQGTGAPEIGIPRVGPGGATALREPVRRDRPQAPGLPRRAPRGPGPRPVRPRRVAASVRPAAPVGAAGRGGPARSAAGVAFRGAPARRVLRPVPVLPAHILRRRRVAAAIGMALLTAVVVVLLGLLADVAAAARAGGSGAVTGPSLTEVAGPSGQVVGPGPR
jgi:hypothetical protein